MKPELRPSHMRRRVIALVTVFWVSMALCLLAAPCVIGRGIVGRLTGNANRIDNSLIWDSLPIFPRLVYYYGDLTCHQKSERSCLLNGNQLPVCARCTGIHVGLAVGFSLMCLLPWRGNLVDTLLPLTRRSHLLQDGRLLAVLLGAGLLGPMTVDGVLQLLTPYESTNPVRLATGILFGFGLAGIMAIQISVILDDETK